MGTEPLAWAARSVTSAGLAVDAYVHADLAGRYDLNQGGAAISQGDLFRIESGLSALAALLVLLSGAILVSGYAFVVAASALGGLLLYLHFDGSIGPLPNMYEPTTYPEKTLAAVAEGIAAASALTAAVLRFVRTRDAARRARSIRTRYRSATSHSTR